MIAAKSYSGKRVAVMGLARSGQSAVVALKAGGADVIAWDDSGSKCKETESLGARIADLKEEDFTKIDALVLSPGIPHSYPKPHEVVEQAKKANTPVIGDIEIFATNYVKPRIIGITGTNGKSTTTSLIGHILKCAQIPHEVGGNIGHPALSFENDINITYQVLELSSYQLELAPSLSCEIGVILNISPDHLDRHGDMSGYIKAKSKIIEGLANKGTAIIGADDPDSCKLEEGLRQNNRKELSVQCVSGSHLPKNGVGIVDGCVVSNVNDEENIIVDLNGNITLPGAHNQQNAAAATAVALAIGISPDIIKAAILTFSGLSHRQELIGSFQNLIFVNDSKATNADATARALSCYDSIYWIAGGRAKQGGIESLGEYFPNIKHAYLFGECAKEFAETLKGKVGYTICDTIHNVFDIILSHLYLAGHQYGVVLLSPAAASFDQFSSYEVRGNIFRSLVNDKIMYNSKLKLNLP